MKNKKVIISIVIILIIIAIIVATVLIINKNNEEKAKQALIDYMNLINDKNYESMYEKVINVNTIDKENFITRNQNIYEGIDSTNISIEIKEIVREDDEYKINYHQKMYTSAGEVEFDNSVNMVKQDKEYKLRWSSKIIFPELNETDRVRVETIKSKRGSILDRNNTPLAEDGQIASVGIVPGKLGSNKDENISRISELTGVSVDYINESLSASYVKDDTFVPIKKISDSNTELKEQLLQISGVMINKEDGRVYSLGKEAGHLIGYVQEINAEELEKNEGKGYTSTSLIGKSGLELSYEDTLRGIDGTRIYILDEEGEEKTEIIKQDKKDGQDVKLTIDSSLQKNIYNQMQNDKGFFVVMEPQTGELLALVSTPTFDSNDFVVGMTTEQWNKLNNDESKPLYNRFIQKYCPGSTFKPVTGAIGLTTDSLSTEDTFTYNGLSWQKDASWGNYNVTTLTAYNGPKNLRNAIIYSDNIYFAQAVLKIGTENFTNTLNKLKFNETIDFPLSLAKSQYSNTDTIDSETLLADSGYGQGQILVNPIHMASIYSAFANDGNMIKPYLEYEENKQVEYLVENAFTKETANIIKDDLIQVVETVGGTAHDMKVNGRTIAAKTGTAELKTSKEDEADILGWIDCFSTDSNSNQMLIISMIEDGRDAGGSRYLKSIIKTLY